MYSVIACLAFLAVSFWIAICFAFSLLVAKAGSGAKSAAPRLMAERLLATARPSTCGDQAEGSASNESIFFAPTQKLESLSLRGGVITHDATSFKSQTDRERER